MTDKRERFTEVYDAYSGLILAYALRRTAGAADATDIVAQTFTIAWRRIDDVPAGEQARPWLYGVARRVLANHHRASKRRRRLEDRAAMLVAQTVLPAVAVADGPDAAAIAAALDDLSETDRELLLLIGWDDLDHDEIAAVLGIRRTTARVRLHRARRRFEQALADHGVHRTSRSGPGGSGWTSVHLDTEDAG